MNPTVKEMLTDGSRYANALEVLAHIDRRLAAMNNHVAYENVPGFRLEINEGVSC